jgi:hypothetical protein
MNARRSVMWAAAALLLGLWLWWPGEPCTTDTECGCTLDCLE